MVVTPGDRSSAWEPTVRLSAKMEKSQAMLPWGRGWVAGGRREHLV